MAAWLWYTTDTPREHPRMNAEELEYIEKHLIPRATHAHPSFWSILAAPSVLALCSTYMLYAFIAWIFILWFPTYLVEVRGFSRMVMGGVGMLPTFGGFVGMIVGGTISDWLLRNGYGARMGALGSWVVRRIGHADLASGSARPVSSVVGRTVRTLLFYLLPGGFWLLDNAA